MAKVKKPSKQLLLQPIKNVKPWVSDKVVEARKLSEHRASRAARRWGAPAGVALLILLFIGSFFVSQDDFWRAKEKLLRDPNDSQAQIKLAEEFLANNQFEEAEKALFLAERQIFQTNSLVLGKQTNPQPKELWQKKYYSDPKDIKRLIAAWEKVIEEKPDYRDGYLQLAYLHYKLYETEEAKEYLEKAIELDPNYELTREMEEILEN